MNKFILVNGKIYSFITRLSIDAHCKEYQTTEYSMTFTLIVQHYTHFQQITENIPNCRFYLRGGTNKTGPLFNNVGQKILLHKCNIAKC